MLSEQQKKEIEAHLGHYEQKRGATLDALKIVQRAHGWVSDEGVRDVAAFLDLSPEDVEGVATFYSLIFRRPVGRHVVLICDSVSCWLTGYADLLAHLERRLGVSLGGTSADGRFTLLPVACLGFCEHAPAMMVDEDLHGDLTPGKVDEILQRYE